MVDLDTRDCFEISRSHAAIHAPDLPLILAPLRYGTTRLTLSSRCVSPRGYLAGREYHESTCAKNGVFVGTVGSRIHVLRNQFWASHLSPAASQTKNRLIDLVLALSTS